MFFVPTILNFVAASPWENSFGFSPVLSSHSSHTTVSLEFFLQRNMNFICKSDEMHGNICVSSYINFFVRFCIGAKSHKLESSYIYYSQKVLACIDGLLFSGYTHKLNLSWIDLVVQIASLCVLTESETETFLDTLYILTTVFYKFFTYQI